MNEMLVDQINDIFGDSDILNYSKILLNAFETNINEINHIMYIEGVDYFNNLLILIDNTPPMILQYVIFTDVMYYFMNSAEAIKQNRNKDRRQFCWDITIAEFGFLHAHILDQEIYGIETENEIEFLCQCFVDNAPGPLINDADWMDDQSKANAIKKADNMKMNLLIF